jgi:hypothetical protein
MSNLFPYSSYIISRSRGSSVGVATGYGTGRSGFYSRHGKIFRFSATSRQVLGSTQPPIQWVPGAPSPGVKRPGREADHSPPTSAEAKNGGAIPPLPYVFMAQCLIN